MDNINVLAEQLLLGGSQESQQISRDRRIAELLMAQGTQQPQGQMISGRYVAPAFSQQIAPLLSAAMGVGLDQKLDKRQADFTKAQKLSNAMQIQKFSELEGAEQMQYGLASGNKVLEGIVNQRLKGDTLKKGEVLTRVGLDGKPIKMEGGLDLPSSIEEAIYYGKLPEDPRTWTPEQSAQARAINVESKKAGASVTDFGALLNKNAPDDVLKMMTEGKIQATGAIQTADAANRILGALDSNKIFTGIGANVKLGAAQLADGLGLGGKDTNEKIGNSRQAMQGLAQLTLQGRKQMRGEGAITESESKLAERAMSGDLNFTAAEIRQLANAAKRSAQFTYNNYNNMQTQLMQDSPRVAPYYKIDANPDIFNTAARPAPTVGQSQTPVSQSPLINRANEIINGKK